MPFVWACGVVLLFYYGLATGPYPPTGGVPLGPRPAVFLPLASGGYPFHRSLKDVAAQSGIDYVGMSLGFSPDHAAYLDALGNTVLPDFNSVTPGNALKMIFLHRCPPVYLLESYESLRTWAYTDSGDHDRDGVAEGRACSSTAPLIFPSPTPTMTLPGGHYLLPTPLAGSYDDWEWDWEQMDGIVLWAKAHGISVYGTPLIWNHATAEWLTVLQHAGVTQPELNRVMRDHIRTIMYHYCQPPFLFEDGTPVVYAYDVVNEAVHFTTLPPPTGAPTPTASPVGLGQGLWNGAGEASLTGDSYVRRAFTYAREVLTDPASPCAGKNIRLLYNDRWTQTSSVLETGVYALSQSLMMELADPGVPLAVPLLDGVGMQMHYEIFYRFAPGATTPTVNLPPNHAGVVPAMQAIAALGLEVKITEADVALIQVARPPTFCGFDPADPRVTLTPVPAGNRPLCSLSDPSPYFALPSATQPLTEASQAQIYAELAAACRSVPTCTGFTTWGLEDEGSWKREYHPLLFTKGTPISYTVTPTPMGVTEGTPVASLMPCSACTRPHAPLATPYPRMTPKPAYHALYDMWVATPTPRPP
jgi:GH35 family endo-1,4-beta-xylanase